MHFQCIVVEFPIDLEALWSRSVYITLNDTRIRHFSAEDLLLLLSMHGCKPAHAWGSLKWVCDVAELIRAYPALDWESISRNAKLLASERMFLLSLAIAHDLLGTALPDEIAGRIKTDKLITQLTAQVRKKMFQETENENQFRRTLEGIRFYFKTREYPRGKLQFCQDYFHYLITPDEKDRVTITLPSYLSFCYYLIRPMRLLMKLGQKLLRLH